MNKKILCIFAAILMLASFAFAHELGEEVQENPALNFATPIWEFHDSIHWMVAVFFFGSCYYFRYFLSRKSGHPKICGLDEKSVKKYGGDFFLGKLHRYFFWAMLILVLIHLSEAITKSFGIIEYNFALFKPYIFPFTTEYEGEMTGVQLLGTAAEWLYVITLLAFLFSCYFARYFLGSKLCFECSTGVKRKIYQKQDFFNNYHGHLFWLSVIISILLLLLGGHL